MHDFPKPMCFSCRLADGLRLVETRKRRRCCWKTLFVRASIKLAGLDRNGLSFLELDVRHSVVQTTLDGAAIVESDAGRSASILLSVASTAPLQTSWPPTTDK